MDFDTDKFQGTDYGMKYCQQHDIYYKIQCPECEEPEEEVA